MAKTHDGSHRYDRAGSPSLRSWQKPPPPLQERMKSNVALEMGWGRLLFGQTFESQDKLADTLLQEAEGRRDIAFYLRDPHVVLSLAPQEFFLDPSHTYRLWSHNYRPASRPPEGLQIRRLRTRDDADAINRIYEARRMVPCDPDVILNQHATRLQTYFLALGEEDSSVVGTVIGVDHTLVFNDPEGGASLWCLAVDPQCHLPGVGQALVRRLVEHYFTRGRNYVDLSVMHDNHEAIRLYEKLGFQRVPVFCLKRKNPINEALFTPPGEQAPLNPYATIITDEAHRRGMRVDVLDAGRGVFRLTYGGRSVTCRESLTDLTSALAFWRCDDKSLTHDLLAREGLRVAEQARADDPEAGRDLLRRHGRLVVKPARGEQGEGITVGVETEEELEAAVAAARQVHRRVLLEQFVPGEDLRVIVINDEVVAAAVRRPPRVTGNGQASVRELAAKYSRRRQAATGGESQVPLDDETERCVRAQGLGLDDVPDSGTEIQLRRTANLHTGGTIHDVTNQLHPELADASLRAARALEIPVVGLDLMVAAPDQPEYVILEANERPGLANHEPQPTAARFLDYLFPQSAGAR